MKITFNRAIEAIGAILGVAGSLLIAVNLPYSKWGFVLYIVSNVFLIGWAVRKKAYGIFSMYVVYTIVNIIGIVRWN